MTRLTYTKCSKCGLIQEGSMLQMEGSIRVPITTFMCWPYKGVYFDLCADCARAFDRWLTNKESK